MWQILITLWSITAKNTDCSTGPLARPFARSLAPLTGLLAPDCSLRSRPPLRSLVRSLAHFARTAHSWESEFLMSQNDLVLSHSGMTRSLGSIGDGKVSYCDNFFFHRFQIRQANIRYPDGSSEEMKNAELAGAFAFLLNRLKGSTVQRAQGKLIPFSI